MNIYLRWIIGILLAVILITLFLPQAILRPAHPVRKGSLSLAGLDTTVQVHFDAYGVPHVYAENEHDLFFAAGYLMAQERLFQMDMVNRSAQGRLAEISPALLLSDRFLRTWGFHYQGKRLAAALNSEVLNILQASSDGINAYIDSHRDNLPVEFRFTGVEPLRWTPAVMLAYIRLMAYELNQAWLLELALARLDEEYSDLYMQDLMPEYAASTPTVVPSGRLQYSDLLNSVLEAQDQLRNILPSYPGIGGSNSWVISGDMTESGRPILANDPHLAFGQPGKWIEMHLVGGRFNVQGVYLPGVPLCVLGQNEDIAWGFTNIMTDDADFYSETVNPADSSRYLFQNQWLRFTERREIIEVRDGAPDTMIVRETVHGVVINEFHPLARDRDHPVVMRWTGQELSREAESIYRLNLARDWSDFSAAARLFGVPGQNVVYADKQGNIGWRPFVRLPLRRGGESLRVLPGAPGLWHWSAWAPFNDMPFLFNPPEGYIATANNPTIGNEFPYYISVYWAPPSRIERITELLPEVDEHTIESSQMIQTDIRSTFAEQITPFILNAYADQDSRDRKRTKALDLLREWDFSMPVESVASTIFNVWFVELVKGVYQDEMDAANGSIFTQYQKLAGYLPIRNLQRLLEKGESVWFDDITTEIIEDRDTQIRSAMDRALKWLSAEMGANMDRWQWGQLHTITFGHSLAAGKAGKYLDWWIGLNVGPVPSAGSNTTVNPGNFSFNAPYNTIAGASVRRIIDVGAWDNSVNILPTGQSGDPFDTHYADQTPLFLAGQYKQTAFSDSAVAQATVSTLTLEPR